MAGDPPKNSFAYMLGQIDGKLAGLDEKMDIMLTMADGERAARVACREHCDTEMPRLNKKVEDMRWKVAAVAGAEVALIGAIIWIIKAHVG